MDIYEIFSRIKKLGITVPPMSTKEEQEKLQKFVEEIRNDLEKPLSEIVELLENDPQKNIDLSNAIQASIKKKWGLN